MQVCKASRPPTGMTLVILTVPVPYEAYVVLPGKRLVEPMHLVASIPVKVAERELKDADKVATWRRGEHRRSYFQVGGHLLAPWSVAYAVHGLQPGQAVPLDRVEDLLPGAAVWQNSRGTKRFNREGWRHQPPALPWQYLGLVPNPFTPRSLALGLETFQGSVLAEGERFRMKREARPGCREEALSFARAAADRMVVHGNHLLVPTSGPCWEVYANGADQSVVARPDALDGRPWNMLSTAWSDIFGPQHLTHALGELRDLDGTLPLPMPQGEIKILREDLPWIDDRGLRLAARARKICALHPNSDRSSLGSALLSSSRPAANAWYQLRDLVADLPIDREASPDIWQVARELVRLEGVGADRLRHLFAGDIKSFAAA